MSGFRNIISLASAVRFVFRKLFAVLVSIADPGLLIMIYWFGLLYKIGGSMPSVKDFLRLMPSLTGDRIGGL